ncbi:MAG: hypothetical protein IKA25_00895 [Alphaproteobacteria bacterium]|nr:hypothetical protein [Alphaproteobacteria bacterium]
MKKILTVSLFAMMAVSAANAEIASTDYVGKQLQPYSTTAQMQSYVSGELAVVNGNNTALSGRVDTLESVVTAEGGVQDAVEAIEKALADDGATGKAIADNTAAITAMDAAYKAADAALETSLKSYADTAEADAIAAAKTAGDAAYDSKGSAAAAQSAAEATAADALAAAKTELEGKITQASTGASTALTEALEDYSTTEEMNSAIASADTALETKVTNAYKAADTALETSLKSYADTAEADAIAAAKTAGDAAYDSKGSAAAAQSAAVSAAKTAADATYQVKSSALSVGAADGAWTDLTKADGYSTTGTHSLVLKNGTIQWEAVSY